MKMLPSVWLMSGWCPRIGTASLSWSMFVAMTKSLYAVLCIQRDQVIFIEIQKNGVGLISALGIGEKSHEVKQETKEIKIGARATYNNLL